MKTCSKIKKIFRCIAVVLCTVFILAIIIYINLKCFTVKRIVTTTGQDVYLMGTFHTDHFDSYANYSVEEMLNAIKNIDPDVVFIEAREENYEDYGVVDGPIDMCITYSYCLDNNIPVEMVDYWKVDNDNYKRNTTTGDRDDHIHQKIMEKLKSYDNKKVLVVCGFGHLYPQTNRLLKEGFKKERISNISGLFKNEGNEFEYPSSVCDVWEQRVLFYSDTYPKMIQADETICDDVKLQWPVDEKHEFYDWQMEYCNLFRDNQLYK